MKPRREQNSNELLSVLKADNIIWKPVRFSVAQRSSCLKTVPKELTGNGVYYKQSKKILKWKRNCFIVQKYTSVAEGREQTVYSGTWPLFDRHTFEMLALLCYLLSYEVSLPRINARLSLGEIEISIENSSSSSRHIYN